MNQNSFTYKITELQGAALEKKLRDLGYEFSALEHGKFRASKGKCGIAYYNSGKLLVQGKDSKEFIEFVLEPEILGQATLGYEEVVHPEQYQPHIGVDESGKGDFFGPLVIAGVYTEAATAKELIAMGVKDSKAITSDKKAKDLAADIVKLLGPRAIETIIMSPEKYNALHAKMRNLNLMLAWAHARVIENLLQKNPSCPRAVSDQFAPKLVAKELAKKQIGIQLESRTKAESDIAVAAASVIARASFLRKLETLGEPLGIPLTKGAGPQTLSLAQKIFADHGEAELSKISKTHFKTFRESCGKPPLPPAQSPDC